MKFYSVDPGRGVQCDDKIYDRTVDGRTEQKQHVSQPMYLAGGGRSHNFTIKYKRDL